MIRDSIKIGLLGLVLAGAAGPAYAQDVDLYESALRPGDVLRITVWPNAELGGEFPVESDGQVFLPFLGGVMVTGVPVQDLREQIRTGFQAAQRNAVVTVTPLYRIGVTGAVQRPGLYLVPPTDGFFDVLTTAGGFSFRADMSKVTVIREGTVLRLDAETALETGETLPLDALSLQSGDQIMVAVQPEGIRFRDWIALANLAISTVLLIDRLQNN